MNLKEQEERPAEDGISKEKRISNWNEFCRGVTSWRHRLIRERDIDTNSDVRRERRSRKSQRSGGN